MLKHLYRERDIVDEVEQLGFLQYKFYDKKGLEINLQEEIKKNS